MQPLRQVRSALGLVAALAIFPIFSLPFYLIVVPGAWLRPASRQALVSWFMKAISRALLGSIVLGGARFRRSGCVPTHTPVLIVANHQSLIDILTITLMSQPFVPAFVTRARYARWIPLVSASVRMLGCPIVDPRRDPVGSLEAVRAGARSLPHGLIIFPEGHRTKDGSVRPFRAGVQNILEQRRLPVYVVVGDGLWKARRLVDFVLNLHHVRGEAEVLGPFEPPDADADLPAFVEGLRDALTARLEELRGRRDAA